MLTNILFVNKVNASPSLIAGCRKPAMPTNQAQVQHFFDPDTATFTYLVYDHVGGTGAVIDPVLDFDPCNGRTSHTHADEVIAFARQQQLRIDWILETHAHADHLSAAPYVKAQLGGRIAIGSAIQRVQATFKELFNLEPGFAADGTDFDHLLADGETFRIGDLRASAWHVPGHTPADMAFVVAKAPIVFVGDTLFMPDVGTARCDFPGGNAHQLYQSIQRLLALPPDTLLYMCHDYPSTGRAPLHVSTVAAQRTGNIHVHEGISEADFVALRQARDATLAMPRLILPAVQVNIRAGHMPPAESDGRHYLKLPINVF